MSNGENPLIGTWNVKSGGGAVQCLFPEGSEVTIVLDSGGGTDLIVLLTMDEQLFEAARLVPDPTDPNVATGEFLLKLQVQKLSEKFILLGANANSLAAAGGVLDEEEIGNWTAEEGGEVAPV